MYRYGIQFNRGKLLALLSLADNVCDLLPHGLFAQKIGILPVNRNMLYRLKIITSVKTESRLHDVPKHFKTSFLL